MYHTIKQIIDKIDFETISAERKSELKVLSDYIQRKKNANNTVHLNFICTHNSRRSQFSQIWAKVAADYFKIDASTYSSGVEVTAMNKRVVDSLKRFGFDIEGEGNDNPHYSVVYSESSKALTAFSKLIEDASNPTENFAAIMTCAHADENCPIVVGCEDRIPIRYDDPKAFDDTALQSCMYDYRSFQIASEMFYVFSILK
ncbi:MAG: protein-tyrosine-phosphatase [Crocinitomix sp.]|nr:protein-tyrosine-phosphatase [Crocinitomix sp.]